MQYVCSAKRRSGHPSGIQATAFLLGAALLLVLSVSSGCALLPPAMTKVAPSSTPSIQPTFASYRPQEVVQVCLDTPPFFSADLFREAANKIADWIDRDVTLNQAGLLVYISLITHQSFQHDLKTISVPAFSADTPEPTSSPTPMPTPGEDPYHYSNTQATVEAANEQALKQWQAATRQRHADLLRVQAAVKIQTNALRSMAPPYDDKAADINGCLQDARQHFYMSKGEKYLIIASAFINNTAENWTPDLALFEAHVRGMYRVCQSAPVCAEKDQTWRKTFLKAGANSDIAFYDPSQSEILAAQF